MTSLFLFKKENILKKKLSDFGKKPNVCESCKCNMECVKQNTTTYCPYLYEKYLKKEKYEKNKHNN